MKRGGRLRRESPRRAAQMRHFRILRDLYLQSHPRCEFPHCDEQAVLVHHKRGRRGARLLDQDWWAASCWGHNEFAETHTGESLAVGWLVRIEGNAA